MKTSSVPLYFPDGIPESVQRIVDPDQIHKLVAVGLKGMEDDWSRLGKKADEVTRGVRPWWKRLFGDSLEVDVAHVMNALYRPMKTWPGNLTAEQKDDLNIIRYLRQYVAADNYRLTSVQRAHPPGEDEMAKAFKMLAKDARPVADRVEDVFQRMITDVGEDIEPLCEAVYGEECPPGEGERVAMADVRDLVRIGRFPSMTPTGTRVMKALWTAIHR